MKMIIAISLIATALSGKHSVDGNTFTNMRLSRDRFGLVRKPCTSTMSITTHQRKFLSKIRGGSVDEDTGDNRSSKEASAENETMYLPGLLEAIVKRKNVCGVQVINN
jgi:hypothetical protein